ncbi:hypothetical protein [Lachnoclostridium sp. Marseille-P6806]|uniref:hypothetical protein n=1 Tax=Lachnoclostridium sp. Marseille-P6806 TaxID=2364793 RepID=UPI001031D369|nr:hypothetical protein [Lachnoclostridium sp. Marseille-P6806]
METKKAMIECSARKVALVDSSKFLTRGLYTFFRYEELDMLITVETEQNKGILREIERKGVTIIRA